MKLKGFLETSVYIVLGSSALQSASDVLDGDDPGRTKRSRTGTVAVVAASENAALGLVLVLVLDA